MSRNELGFFNDNFDLLDPFFNDDFFKAEPRHQHELLKTDVVETADGYELIMDVPGIKKENINLDLEDGYLTISATKSSKEDEGKKNYVRRERQYFSAKRSFYVGSIEESDIKAKLENGELHIVVPKETEKVINKKQISIE